MVCENFWQEAEKGGIGEDIEIRCNSCCHLAYPVVHVAARWMDT